MQTEQYSFEDDGKIPNSVFPAILYKKAFDNNSEIADNIEEKFIGNNWKNSWRNGVYDYHHYHSTAHEVLGVYSGSAEIQLGGEKGKKFSVSAGDVMVLPAGTGHKKISASDDFGVIGAYPDGMEYDICTGKEGERPEADNNIAKAPFPDCDPVQGKNGGILEFWK